MSNDAGLNRAFILDAWVPALRSGEFAQGHGSLRVGDRYCCLGVACELLRRAGVAPDWTPNAELPDTLEMSGYVYSLPLAVADHIGIHARGAIGAGDVVVGGGRYGSLAEANDDGRSFAEIAAALVAACEAAP